MKTVNIEADKINFYSLESKDRFELYCLEPEESGNLILGKRIRLKKPSRVLMALNKIFDEKEKYFQIGLIALEKVEGAHLLYKYVTTNGDPELVDIINTLSNAYTLSDSGLTLKTNIFYLGIKVNENYKDKSSKSRKILTIPNPFSAKEFSKLLTLGIKQVKSLTTLLNRNENEVLFISNEGYFSSDKTKADTKVYTRKACFTLDKNILKNYHYECTESV